MASHTAPRPVREALDRRHDRVLRELRALHVLELQQAYADGRRDGYAAALAESKPGELIHSSKRG